MRKPASMAGWVAMILWLSVPGAFAQGGGASSTGAINGRVADTSGGILPGVTVTASSPSLMGVQTAITNDTGAYRFPALPPGTYSLSYELAGFNSHASETISRATGLGYQKPSAILVPRTARIGFRFLW
jgi:hypothetical protein